MPPAVICRGIQSALLQRLAPETAEMPGACPVLLHPPSLTGSQQSGEGPAGLCVHLHTPSTLVRIPG